MAVAVRTEVVVHMEAAVRTVVVAADRTEAAGHTADRTAVAAQTAAGVVHTVVAAADSLVAAADSLVRHHNFPSFQIEYSTQPRHQVARVEGNS